MAVRIDPTENLAIRQLFNRLDADGNGEVEKAEMIENRPDGLSEEQAAQIYDYIDSPQRGMFTRGDLTTTFEQLSSDTRSALILSQAAEETAIYAPDYTTEADPADLFAQLDTDGDGIVSYDNFLHNQPQVISETEAETFWAEIVRNSGAPEGTTELDQETFTVGYNAALTLDSTETGTAMSDTTVSSLMEILDTASTNNEEISLLFLQLDGDLDQAVSVDDLLNLKSPFVEADQVIALWEQITGNLGMDSVGSLNFRQFSRGFDAVGLTGTDGSALKVASASIDEVMEGLALANTVEPGSFNMTTQDAQELFARLDGNGDGVLGLDDFVTGMSEQMNATQAIDLWTQIAENSGSADSTNGLSENLFITGFDAVKTLTIENAVSTSSDDSEVGSVDNVLSLLRSISALASQPFDMWNSDPAKLFGKADGNGDGVISYDDFRNALPDSVSSDLAEHYWMQIVENSGSADASGGLTENLFMTGFETVAPLLASTTSSSSQSTNSSILSQLSELLTSLSSGKTSSGAFDIWTADPTTLFAEADTNGDGVITFENFADSLPPTVSEESARAYWDAIESNSGSADSSRGLTENLFLTGFDVVASTTANAGEEAVSSDLLSKFSSLLDNLNLELQNPISLGISDPYDIFAQLDEDADGVVTLSNYLNAKLDDVTTDRATVFWEDIARNGGGDAEAGLTSEQFAVGYAATSAAAMELTNIHTLDQLTSLLGGINLEETTSRTSARATTTATTLDTDEDGAISRDEFLTGLNNVLSAVNNSTSSADNQDILEDFVQAIRTYQETLTATE